MKRYALKDESSGNWGKFIEDCLNSVLKIIPENDLNGVEEILILDECPDGEYSWAGGFYNAKHDSTPASIELYPPKIIAGQPFFLPKTKFFKKYSIIKMFLHELGHHKYGISSLETREREAQEYMLSHLKKMYGNWIYFFDFLAKLDNFFRNNKKKHPRRCC